MKSIIILVEKLHKKTQELLNKIKNGTRLIPRILITNIRITILFFLLKLLNNFKNIRKTKQRIKKIIFKKKGLVIITKKGIALSFISFVLFYMWFFFLISHYVLAICIFLIGTCWLIL